MRVLLLLTFFLAGSIRADDAATAIVNKSLKATGWGDRKSDYATWKEKGKFTFGGMSADYTGDYHVTYPDKYRFTMTLKIAGNDVQFTVVLNGDQAWESGAGRTEEIKKEKLAYLKEELHQMLVLSLKPLVDPKGGFKTAVIDPATIDGKKCVGISAAKEGKPTVKLWFDETTGLPAKIEAKVKNEFDDWKEATDEVFLTDWADADVGKAFKRMKIVRNGKTMLESELSDYKTPEKVDPKLYEKP